MRTPGPGRVKRSVPCRWFASQHFGRLRPGENDDHGVSVLLRCSIDRWPSETKSPHSGPRNNRPTCGRPRNRTVAPRTTPAGLSKPKHGKTRAPKGGRGRKHGGTPPKPVPRPLLVSVGWHATWVRGQATTNRNRPAMVRLPVDSGKIVPTDQRRARPRTIGAVVVPSSSNVWRSVACVRRSRVSSKTVWLGDP